MMRTAAKNLEEKFDPGEEVLDYFDVRKARVIDPKFRDPVAKTKLGYPVESRAHRRAVVREKSARYRKKAR